MKYCVRCGKSTEDQEAYCSNCGTPANGTGHPLHRFDPEFFCPEKIRVRTTDRENSGL